MTNRVGNEAAGREGRRWFWAGHMLRQPGLAARAVVVTVVLLLLLPIAVLLIAMVLVAGLLAALSIAGQRAIRTLQSRGRLPRSDGRRNVRVVARQDS